MATVIRMKRGGRTHSPYYRVVVMDSRRRTRGREIEQIGFYHPCARPEPVTEIDTARALSWLQKGARPSDTVRDIFSKKGIMAVYSGDAKFEDITPTPEPVAAAVEPGETAAEPAAEVPEPIETAPEPTAEVPEPIETAPEPDDVKAV